MRHRVIPNFEAEAEGINPDKVLLEILQKVPEKAEESKAARPADAAASGKK
jgi:MoxR-like ATPase